MKFPVTISFTPAEWAIIEDRLAEPDAIADVLTDAMEGEVAKFNDRNAIMMAAANLFPGPLVTVRDNVQLAVLQDAIEGSTIPYKLYDQVELGDDGEKREARLAMRQLRAIEKKFTTATGLDAKFPKA